MAASIQAGSTWQPRLWNCYIMFALCRAWLHRFFVRVRWTRPPEKLEIQCITIGCKRILRTLIARFEWDELDPLRRAMSWCLIRSEMKCAADLRTQAITSPLVSRTIQVGICIDKGKVDGYVLDWMRSLYLLKQKKLKIDDIHEQFKKFSSKMTHRDSLWLLFYVCTFSGSAQCVLSNSSLRKGGWMP